MSRNKMAEAEADADATELKKINSTMDDPKLGKVSESRVLTPVDGNRSVEANGSTSSGSVVESSSHGNSAMFGSTTFGTVGQNSRLLATGSSLPSSTFGSSSAMPGHGAWQPPYRPPTIFGGAVSSQGNPFAEITSMKQPGVSRSGATNTSQPCEGLIAPSRFGSAAFSRKPASSDTESDDDRLHNRPVTSSILAPPRIVVGEKKESPLSAPKFSLRPSVLSSSSEKVSDTKPTSSLSGASLFKPAMLVAPSTENTKNTESEVAEPSTSDEKCTSERVNSQKDEAPRPDSSNNGVDTPASSQASSSGADSTEPENYSLFSQSADIPGEQNAEAANVDGFIFGRNLTERVMGVSCPAISSSTSFGGATSNNASSNHGSSGDASGQFVFGQNLANRVVNVEKTENEETPEAPDTTSVTPEKTTPEKGARSLEESAREYQAKHEVKAELKEVEVKTGEEEESNVLTANCKLFVFENNTQTWVERGRGQLRLNDMAHAGTFQSRLVMRTHGSLRLILNTKIWAGMTVERASAKSIRITASDTDEVIKVFLITGSPKDSENILSAIDWRIQRLQVVEERADNTTAKTTEKRKADSQEPDTVIKKQKRNQEPIHPGEVRGNREESNDSSVGDPETEASSESHCSSLTGKSEDECH